MKEYPILFKGAMIRAILSGQKTVTRRIDVDRWLKRKKGDLLWCKEVFQAVHWDYEGEITEVPKEIPKAGGRGHYWDAVYAADDYWEPTKKDRGFSWRSSLHMPRWASRITLKLIEDPYTERLQDITEEDAKAEGCDPSPHDLLQLMTSGKLGSESPYRGGYSCLWDVINPETTWYTNPLVAVVRFRRVEQVRRAA